MRLKKSNAAYICLAISLSTCIVCSNITPAFAETVSVSNESTSDTTTVNTEKPDAENTKEELLKNVENAQKEYDSAKKAYDEAPLKFLESNCPSSHKYTGKDEPQEENYYYIDNQLEHLKNSSYDLFKKAYAKYGNSLKEHFTFSLLRGEADLLDECNKRRAADTNFTEKENNAPLKLAPELVLTAMTDSMILYAFPNDYHQLYYKSYEYDAIWDYVSNNMQGIDGRVNPFIGWYDEELEKYNNGVTDKDEIGHYEDTMKAYGGYRNVKTWEADPDFPGEERPVTNKVHYYGRAGFGVFYNKKLVESDPDDSKGYMWTYSANFGAYNSLNKGGKLYTSDEWRKAVDEYEAPLKERLDAAEKALKEAKEAAGITDDKDNTGKDDGNNPGGNTGKEDTDKPGTGDSGKEDPSTPSENPEVKHTTIDSIKLSTTKYTYDGKAKMPSVSVYANGKKLDKTGYTIRYSSGRKNIGSYTVNVTGLQDNGYTGSKSATFQIVPKTLKTPSVKARKKKVAIKWAKVSGGVKYQIAIAKKGSKYKYYSVSGSKKTIKKLSKGKKYTVRVRAYKKVGSKTYYGSWSKGKTVKVK